MNDDMRNLQGAYEEDLETWKVAGELKRELKAGSG